MKTPSLSRQILSWMLWIALIPVGLLSVYYLSGYNTQFKQNAFQLLDQIADDKSNDLNHLVSNQIDIVNVTAKLPQVIQAISQLTPLYQQGLQSQPVYQQKMTGYADQFQSLLELGFYDLFLISTQGDILLTLKQEADLFTNLSQGAYADSQLAKVVRLAFTMQEPSLSSYQYYPPSQEDAAFLAAPVLNQGVIIGVVAFQIDITKIQQIVNDQTRLMNQGHSQLLIADNAYPLTQPSLLHSDGIVLQPDLIQQIIAGQNSAGIINNQTGQSFLTVGRYLPHYQSVLIVQLDQDEVFTPLYQYQQFSLLFVLVLIGLLIILAKTLTGVIAQPIDRLTELTQKISQGEHQHQLNPQGYQETQQLAQSFNRMMEKLDIERQTLEQRVFERTAQLQQQQQFLSLTLNSIGDAVIVTDQTRRIIRMNPVAEALTGWAFKQAQGEVIEQVFQIIESDSQLVAANLVETVIQTGQIVHLSNHTTLISKNNQHYQISDTAAPIFDDQQQIIGVVLVFNDVSEHYRQRQLEQQMLEKLRQSEQHLRLYRDQSSVATLEWNLDAQIVDWNPAAERLFGYSLAEVQGRNALDFLIPESSKIALTELWNNLVSGHGGEYSINPNVTKSGQEILCQWHNTPLRDLQQQITGVASLVIDVTEQQQMQSILLTLAESKPGFGQTLLQLIVEQMALTLKVDYAFLAIVQPQHPDVLETLVSWRQGQWQPNFSYFIADTPCQQVIEQCRPCLIENQVQSQYPQDQYLSDMAVESYLGIPLLNDNHQLLGLLAVLDHKPMSSKLLDNPLIDSLTVRASIELERQQATQKLQLAAQIFEQTHEGITLTDEQGKIIDVNPAFTRITGYQRDEVLGKNPNILQSGRQDRSFYRQMWKSLKSQGHWQGEMWDKDKEGRLFAQRITIFQLLDKQGYIKNYVGLFSDITATKKQQQMLEKMAHYDLLTQLPNRVLFADRIEQAIARSKRDQTLLAIGFLDLDEFKPVNDRYGHEVGDQLLVEVAQRMKTVMREQDTVSRMGGDEFTLLICNLQSVQQCEQILKRLHQLLAEPYYIAGQTIEIAASCGVTLYPQNQADADTLIRHADSAMYQAKLAGRNQFKFFDLDQAQQQVKQQNQFIQVQQAYQQQQFQLFYQPKVNMMTGKVYGFEALIRWIDEQGKIIPPLSFLPALAGTDLEIEVGNWVIEQALSQLEIWQQQPITLKISVNVSAYHLLNSDFVEQLEGILARFPAISSEYLQLEILESGVLSEIEQIVAIIRQCRFRLGVRIALDDFGTGYSSLTHLRQIPADTIKIDQSFVRDMLDNKHDSTLVEGVIALAQAFDQEVIAEGVESSQVGLALLKLGCCYAQGYGIAKPMPAQDVIDWLAHYQAYPEWLNFSSTDR